MEMVGGENSGRARCMGDFNNSRGLRVEGAWLITRRGEAVWNENWRIWGVDWGG
jgi:hypothetical protein